MKLDHPWSMREYYFWIDVSIQNSDEDKAINEIVEKGIFVRILGKY